ncbi:uncharacterized protein PGTG_05883 [Puccinia graminis f. sp. tritici CRL 75-36-700-3]|uniref:C2H2-type domain-containing protein n=1 Tax=Puccinia graminis f. sp. tritici (strain CRL 75-36-700-3 / race SCCL) TaxID=418459 RepID=E3K5Z1_PUCGT|nr:uncharacterized protein PGTG_05883 [Puccinia graminis f. sp. tritici CRL 75-36-700-3]EFP79562.1 hypothetical protein PGTG_05883 [Puccinia graminis f. sp. tritici CRL 75-36-700-3]
MGQSRLCAAAQPPQDLPRSISWAPSHTTPPGNHHLPLLNPQPAVLMCQSRLARTESQTASPETEPQVVAGIEPQGVAELEPQAAAETEPQAAAETEPQAVAKTEPQAAAETEPQATAGIEPQAVTQIGVSYEKLPEDMPDDRSLDQALPIEKPAEAVSDEKNQAVTDQQIPQPEAPQAQQKTRLLCKPCNRKFAEETHYENHLIHSPRHFYCKKCKRDFASESARQAHLTHAQVHKHDLSRRHQFRGFSCPSRECRGSFLSESGVLAHLESGCCTSGADQAMVDKSMVIQDSKQVFIRHARVALPEEREVPIEKTINPCPLCPKKFRYRAGLLQHLGSSKHTNKGREPYKCPASTCDKATFPSLSSLLLHKERGKCNLDLNSAIVELLDHYLHHLYDGIRKM